MKFVFILSFLLLSSSYFFISLGDIPQIYGNLYDLKLRGNRFTGFSPAFEKPPQPLHYLTRIDVSENNLTTFPESLLSNADPNFPILTEVVAAKNRIQQEFMPSMTSSSSSSSFIFALYRLLTTQSFH
jgi:hypothetical protein